MYPKLIENNGKNNATNYFKFWLKRVDLSINVPIFDNTFLQEYLKITIA